MNTSLINTSKFNHLSERKIPVTQLNDEYMVLALGLIQAAYSLSNKGADKMSYPHSVRQSNISEELRHSVVTAMEYYLPSTNEQRLVVRAINTALENDDLDMLMQTLDHSASLEREVSYWRRVCDLLKQQLPH